MNICIIGGNGKLGSVIADHVTQFYPVRIADRQGGEPTAEATRDADVVIVIVDTPSLPDGRYDVSNVIEACAEIDLSREPLVMISSTVNPGDTEGPIRWAMEGLPDQLAHDAFGLAYVPEFVRQGNVLKDFAHPAYIIAGCKTNVEQLVLSEFYETVCGTTPTFMSIQSAEIMKIGLNTALTAKLAKANEIAWLCQRTPGADARDVLDAIKGDLRISPLYFSAGPPHGGPCLPRDDAAFATAWRRAGLGPSLAEGVPLFRKRQIIEMATLAGTGGMVGVAGLSFKPGVVDATESPGAAVATLLDAETYDPDLPSTCNCLAELIEKCDVIVLAMPFARDYLLLEMALGDTVVWDWWGAFGDRFRRFGRANPL